MARRNDHGGGFVPNGSQTGAYQNTRPPAVYGAPGSYDGDYGPPSQVYNNGSPGNAHGGGYVPNQQSPARSIQGSPQASTRVDGRYVPTVGYNTVPNPGQAPTYQAPTYQAPAYQAPAYQAQTSQAQGNYATSSFADGRNTPAYVNPQPYSSASVQQSIPTATTGQPSRPRDTAVRILRLVEPAGISDTLPEFDQHHRTNQKGLSNLSHPLNKWRYKYPSAFQMPQLRFRSKDKRRHRDIMQRVHKGPEEDCYLSPADGHLAKLMVQAAQDVYDGAPNTTWRRTFVRNISPPYIRIANWPFQSVPIRSEHWTQDHWVSVCLRWLPACGAMFCTLLMNPNGLTGKERFGFCYDPFPYKHWGYPKTARNVRENPPSAILQRGDLAMNRALGPRYLCFLNDPRASGDDGVTVERTSELTANTEYIFIGYSTKQFDNSSNVDMQALHQMAERAAREASVPAFWVAGSCMPDRAEMEDDVYRISDVMRRAHSLVIVVGPEPSSPLRQTRDELLKSWGTRMWTLPEALLSPSEKKIKVYTRGYDGPAWEIDKKHFAEVAWNDPLISRQLVEHYGKNLLLSPLELVTIALKCLRSRERGEYLNGDLSYALMGLLRQRPTVDSSDSDFLAFARLSMANDSNLLLERLICMQPPDHTSSWLSMDDAWDANLWDIYPSCQVAGIGPGDTVIIDGAFGAAIRWKAFLSIAYFRKESWKRLGTRIILHGAPVYFLAGILMSKFPGSLRAYGIFILVLSLLVILASPYLTRVVYNGKLWGSQAGFQGFEGYMDLATIESHIFGAYMGRLKWSPAGSPLSSHHINNDGECVGVDPMIREDVRRLVENAKTGGSNTLKVFTIIDTYSLTVTMFAAIRPPIAAILCGHEGGMQRAVMCSYDWANQTLYKETVLRMETPVLGRMSRVNRFRFGLQRPPPKIQ